MLTLVVIILAITVLYGLYRLATGHAREDYMSLDEVRETYFGSSDDEE